MRKKIRTIINNAKATIKDNFIYSFATCTLAVLTFLAVVIIACTMFNTHVSSKSVEANSSPDNETTFVFMADECAITNLHQIVWYGYKYAYENDTVRIGIDSLTNVGYHAKLVDAHNYNRILGFSNNFTVIAEELINN